MSVHFSSKSSEWETPEDLYNKLNQEFSFTLDPACTSENCRCEKGFYHDMGMDGLIEPWMGERVFMNPPYGRAIGGWIEKAYKEYSRGVLVVALLPARTDTHWFHDYIYKKAEIRFLKGRLKFSNAENSAPFPSMVVVWRGRCPVCGEQMHYAVAVQTARSQEEVLAQSELGLWVCSCGNIEQESFKSFTKE